MQRLVPGRKGPRVPSTTNSSLTSSSFPTFFYFLVLLSLLILHVAETFRRRPGTRLRHCENIKFSAHKLKDSAFPAAYKFCGKVDVWRLVDRRFMPRMEKSEVFMNYRYIIDTIYYRNYYLIQCYWKKGNLYSYHFLFLSLSNMPYYYKYIPYFYK